MSLGTNLPSQWPRERKLRIAAAYYPAYILVGLMLTSIGPCMKALEKQSGSSKGEISLLVVVMSLGYIAGSLLGARLYARLAGNRVLTNALLAMALLTTTIPWLGPLWLLIVVFSLIGVTLGTMDVGGNTLMVWLYRSEVPPYMNALHLSFGVGAFLGPLIINGFAAATGNAVTTYWLFAGLMLPVALWLSRLPSPDAPPVVQDAAAGRAVLRPHLVLIGLIAVFFFLHMGAELSFGAYIASYADDLFYSESLARVVNSVFWGGLVVGRLIAIPLALRISPRALLQSSLLVAAASLAPIIALPGSSVALWIGTIGFGIAIASMFANSINFAEQRMPITSQVTAVFLVGGSLGSTVLPLVVGQLYEPRGPETMMQVTGAALLAALLLFGIIQVYARRPRRPVGPPPDLTAPGPGSRQPRRGRRR
jgi:FHS family Na+ dependent glucose MFS transporter 1